MVASTFGAAFDALDHTTQSCIITSLCLRRRNYENAKAGARWEQAKIILIGDRPGPGAKNLPAGHHHTPFYSTKNSSLWLNRQLVEHGIQESNLVWLNAYDLHGTPAPADLIADWTSNPKLVVLGGNAEKWLLKVAPGCTYEKVHHPQAWKRFHSKKPYPLVDVLRTILDLQKTD